MPAFRYRDVPTISKVPASAPDRLSVFVPQGVVGDLDVGDLDPVRGVGGLGQAGRGIRQRDSRRGLVDVGHRDREGLVEEQSPQVGRTDRHAAGRSRLVIESRAPHLELIPEIANCIPWPPARIV